MVLLLLVQDVKKLSEFQAAADFRLNTRENIISDYSSMSGTINGKKMFFVTDFWKNVVFILLLCTETTIMV